MSVLTKIRGRARERAGRLTRSTFGEAVVVHPAGGATAEARALAASLPVDPDHLLVVADLQSRPSVEVWEAFAAALPGGRPVVVLPLPVQREIDPRIGQWLAARTGGAVLIPHGQVYRDSGGTLFAHSGPHTGWLRFGDGQGPVWGAKRLPRPAWDFTELAETRGVGECVAEPLPAGMWLRPAGSEAATVSGRMRLTRTIPCHRDEPVIVLGGPGLPDLPMADVVAFWQTLPAEVRATAWFARFGGIGLPEGTAFGPALADALGAEVRCHTGIPGGAPPDVFAVRPDGSYGWKTFAKSFVHRPGGVTELLAHRSPVEGLSEVSPGVYQCEPEIVAEVVESGLWVRPAGEAPARAPMATLDPVRALVHYETSPRERADRLRAAAERLVRQLDYATSLATVLVPHVAPAPEPVEPDEPRPDEDDSPLPVLSRIMDTLLLPRVSEADPIPRQARARDTEVGWLRQVLAGEFAEHAGPAEATIAANPSWLAKASHDDLLAGLIAARVYLAGRGFDLDAEPHWGPQAARFARHVISGLEPLPPHQGTAVTTLELGEAQWAHCLRNPVLLEPGFLHLVTEPRAEQRGNVDLLVWSVTGRRTSVLEPGQDGLPDRVVFLPGTTFRVVDSVPPGEGYRGWIALREVPTDDPAAAEPDEEILELLGHDVEGWVDREPRQPIPAAIAERFRVMPGRLLEGAADAG